jgi:hypothetical protein
MAMDKAAEPDNARLRKEGKAVRWIPDQTVTVTLWLSGTSDLIYLQTGMIVDCKVPGVSKMTEYRKKGPPPTYPIQDHLYGRGYADMGHDVKHWYLVPSARGQPASSVLCGLSHTTRNWWPTSWSGATTSSC